ncbi:hypothetical protein PInf_024745 [Phytophthora infestans]|nr:hypothetical protein PInf_024745 [Phytophthora infestans]
MLLRFMSWGFVVAFVVSSATVSAKNATTASTTFPTKSGIRAWVDPETPDDRQTYVSSRGRTWDLVMSVEFNTLNRSFRPGDDHIWTSLEKPDGVNGAMELYLHNMTSTMCDDDGTCFFYIKAVDEVNVIHVACDDNPGYGLNPNQGRGAPEIDLLEGGGLAVSSSLQIAPGMPDDYRLFPVDTSAGDNLYCVYGYSCTTPGANYIDVPTAFYERNVATSRGTKAFASGDVNADIGLIDDNGGNHWGMNTNGTCYPLYHAQVECHELIQLPDGRNIVELARHLGACSGYAEYQIEWVTGKNGYVRWMLAGSPLFEVTTDAFSKVPQNSNKTNPQKFVGATPPNPGKECRGDGKDPYLKIDYMRLYQDLGDDVDADNYMQVGCDPKSHPTKKWIEAHIDEYEDDDNRHEDVAGKAFCTVDDDCTIGEISARQR